MWGMYPVFDTNQKVFREMSALDLNCRKKVKEIKKSFLDMLGPKSNDFHSHLKIYTFICTVLNFD